MITFVSENLIHFYLAGMLVIGGGCIEGIRRLMRRDRIARGVRS
ncbi:hypothetical protein [Pseudomonas sp. FP1742]|nr:hypothetical protein [Pseudomonas sp. FP1742]WLG49134.1 hypothetical protein PSH64_20665 [Pseudomonas sp. FP1742]